jgi:hypothetical protein
MSTLQRLPALAAACCGMAGLRILHVASNKSFFADRKRARKVGGRCDLRQSLMSKALEGLGALAKLRGEAAE